MPMRDVETQIENHASVFVNQNVTERNKMDKQTVNRNSYSIVMLDVISYLTIGILVFIAVRLQNKEAIQIIKKLLLICVKFNRHMIPMIWVETHEPAKQLVIRRIKRFMAKFSFKID